MLDRPAPPHIAIPHGGESLAELEALVALAFRVTAAAMRAPSRGPAEVAFARQVAMYLACTRLGVSYTDAGAAFGRDRTTAAHACRLVEERRDDPRIDSVLDYLERAVLVSLRTGATAS